MMVNQTAMWFTPLILLPGIVLFLISTAQRFSMITMDVKHFIANAEMRHPEEGKILNRRAKLLGFSMICLYLSLVFFCFAAMFTFFSHLFANEYYILTLPLILLSVFTLLFASIALVYESWLSTQSINHMMRGL